MKYKKCRLCLKYKPISSFSTDKKGKRAKAAHCKKCYRETIYPKNYNLIKEWGKNKAKENKLKAIKYLGGKCTKCKQKVHHAAFDFHHVDPKTKTKYQRVFLKWKWERIKTELDKCVLLCANCHRTYHYKERNNETNRILM